MTKNLLKFIYYKKISEKSKTNGKCYDAKTFIISLKVRKAKLTDGILLPVQNWELKYSLMLIMILFKFYLTEKRNCLCLTMWFFTCCARCIKAQIKANLSARKNSWSNFMSPRWKEKEEQGKKKRLYNTKLMQYVGPNHVSCYLTYKLFVFLDWILFSFTV